jgi:hypothetical protein
VVAALLVDADGALQMDELGNYAEAEADFCS